MPFKSEWISQDYIDVNRSEVNTERSEVFRSSEILVNISNIQSDLAILVTFTEISEIQ